MNEMQLIECRKIKSPRGDTLKQATLQYLEASIRAEGLLNPIVVRPDPEKVGHYLIVAGRHRYHVKSKVLKEDVIEARVFADMGEAEAELATLAENLCRNHLSGAKRTQLIQKWQGLYREKYPELVGKRAGGTARARKAASRPDPEGDPAPPAGDEAATVTVTDAEKPEPEAAPATDRPPTFSEHASDVLGVSKSTIEREVRLANRFDADELEVFEQMQVGRLDQLAIADIDDASLRSQVVALVASGMEPVDAIREVTGLTEIKAKNGTVKSTEPEPRARPGEDGRPDEALSDDEWFEAHCGTLRDLLAKAGNPGLAKFRSDAILFRQVAEARHAFRKKVKKAVKAAQDGRVIGPFFVTINRLISFAHPKDWFICDGCGGAGSRDAHECKGCMGGGYRLRTEKYL
jgi:hypothetical protein